MKVVRWLGAYGKSGSLADSLAYELGRPATDEVCAEQVNGISAIDHARVGLLVARKAVIKRFKGDAWSVYQGGKLVKTRKPANTKAGHTEVWCNPVYKAVVVKSYVWQSLWEDPYEASHHVMRLAQDFALQHGLKFIVVDQHNNWREVAM